MIKQIKKFMDDRQEKDLSKKFDEAIKSFANDVDSTFITARNAHNPIYRKKVMNILNIMDDITARRDKYVEPQDPSMAIAGAFVDAANKAKKSGGK